MATPDSKPNIEVTNNEAQNRFEAQLEGEVAFAAYTRRGDTLTFTHTEVPDEFQGQGVGTELVRGALQQVRDDSLKVVPQCPFVASFIDENPEYRSLLEG